MKKKNSELQDMICEFVQKFIMENQRIPSTSEIGDEMGISIDSDSIGKYDSSMTPAAIIGSIHCGEPQFEEENIEAYVNLPSQIFGKEDCYILRASGESMIDAGIDDGDLVVIRKQWFAKDGEIVAALVDGESTLKIYHAADSAGVPYLQAANKKDSILYPDIYAHNSLYIQGVAVFVIKQVGTLTAG